jgi:hypothetical protein
MMNATLTRVATVLLSLVLSTSVGWSLLTPTASASPTGPAWTIRSFAQPTYFSPMEDGSCEEPHGEGQACDSYKLIVTNAGSATATAPVTIEDALPTGVTGRQIGSSFITGEDLISRQPLKCTTAPLQCTDESAVPPNDTLVVKIEVTVAEGISGSVENSASVVGGGTPAITTRARTAISSAPAQFGIQDFSFQPFSSHGVPDLQAGGHPYSLTTTFDLNTEIEPELEESGFEDRDEAVEEARDLTVDLPLGLVGDPLATPRCPLNALLLNNNETHCPSTSAIGTVVFDTRTGVKVSGGAENKAETTDIYNMQPEAGYPAEFGFTYLGKGVFMYASAIRGGSGYELRVTAPGIPRVRLNGASLTFFGQPQGSTTPFLTNPVDCSSERPMSARIEADSWENPGHPISAESPYSSESTNPSLESLLLSRLTGCEALQFHPSLAVRPDTTQADEPSGYGFTITVPQQGEDEDSSIPATPELKDVTLTLPPGVSVSSAIADGIAACQVTGPEGINIGSGDVEPNGNDVGDPEATEIGDGYPGGDGSPYADGQYHTAPGHCPAASTIGTVEATTPLLEKPLEGHVYLAQPQCGGAGQEPCTEADATNGTLFGIYIELAGSGVIVKLAGSVSVNPTTGQITTSFHENPQVPVSSLTVHLDGGPRAALANPQMCGRATTLADLSAWSAPVTPDVTPSPWFDVDWDGAGGACPSSLPFSPSLIGTGTISPAAGAFSPFTLTLSRGDRQQYLSQLSVHMPPGLLGVLSGIPLCGEPQAASGTCSQASEIGTTTVAAGAGSHPFWITGRVYLTGSYRGAPFGLSVVVPAVAGPFNLGDVVVRAAINVDLESGALTITSDPLPQIIDGIPLRIQTVNVTAGRPGFVFNPTNCSQQQIAVTVAGAQGASASLSSPFAAAGCRSLPFSPKLTASTEGKTSKASGASLDVKIAYKPGQANTKSLALSLPKQLPARLTTIQKACLAATFEANPATCPPQSSIGIAMARTPVLPVALVGPVYLVSHGGAAFPDVVVVVQGDGVRIDQRGAINIAKNGVTSSTFANLPDAPLTSIDVSLPEGPHSALATNLSATAKSSLCQTALAMPTTLTGQNGVQLKQSTRIAVSGCPKVKAKAKKRKKAVGRANASSSHGADRGSRS